MCVSLSLAISCIALKTLAFGKSYLHLVYKKTAAVFTKKTILNFIYTRKKTGCK